MTNKLKNEQEIKLILSVIINNYCTGFNDNYGESWEDVEPQFINELYKTVADEIASAREDSARGFLDYMNDKELWNSHWDKVEIISRVEDYVKKLKE